MEGLSTASVRKKRNIVMKAVRCQAEVEVERVDGFG